MMKKEAQVTPNTRLKAQRLRKQWSQVYVATMIGTNNVTVSRWENGTTFPSLYYRQQLCELFGKSAEDLGVVPTAEETNQDEGKAPEYSPAIWNVPTRRNPFFTGREDILERLHTLLHSDQRVALTQVQAISGLGGIGKTQVAIEYAYRHRDDYHAVLWVKADTPEGYISNLAALAGVLKLSEQEDADQERLVQALTRWLKTHTNWLLILDNVEDVTLVSEILSCESTGHILLTTRAQATGMVARQLDLDQMEPEEGALFLLRRSKRVVPYATLEEASSTDQAMAREITHVLGGLPLALDQAGAYIEETGCSLSTYLERYNIRQTLLLQRRGQLFIDHPQSVSTTFSLSIERIEQACPAASELLQLCAFLDPDAIPEELLSEGATELSPLLQQMAADPLQLDAAIAVLRSFSLVRRNSEAHTLTVHRLVQAVLIARMDAPTQRQWAERAVRVVNLAFPDVNVLSARSAYQCYLPHAQRCAEFIARWEMGFPEAARLLHQMGVSLKGRAQYAQAEEFLSKARDLRMQVLGPTHPAVAESLYELADLAQSQGKYAQVEPLHQRALAIREQALGPEHPDVATSLHGLAVFYYYYGTSGQDEPLFLRALSIRRQALGDEHPLVALLLNNLALLYHDQGKDAQAEPLYQQALTIFEKTLGSRHSLVAMGLGNLANLCLDQGRYTQAESLLQRALAIHEEIFGPEHPFVASNLNSLARIYRAQGQYAQAERLHQRALAIREQALGPEHSTVAISLNSLGQCYMEQGQYEQAEPLLERALTILEKTPGPEHLYTGRCLHDLAKLSMARARYEQAEPLFKRALTIIEKIQDFEHLEVPILLEDYALLLSATKREAEAAQLVKRAEKIRAKYAQQNMPPKE